LIKIRMTGNVMATTQAANRKSRSLELALEEILGQSGSSTLLDSLDPSLGADLVNKQGSTIPAWVIQAVLEETYGSRAGCGLTMRIGRVCFIYILREYGAEVGLTDQAFKLLPQSMRMKKGNEMFAFLFMQLAACRVRQEQDDKVITWIIEPVEALPGNGRKTSLGMLAAGFLQEALTWMSGGKVFQVETRCDPQGEENVCRVVIDRVPVSN
jgi:predicted hydrocarbon binding protein